MRDRRKGRTFEQLMAGEDFGAAWMEHLKVFFSDWELTSAEVVALIESSAKMARETLVPKPD